MAVSGKASQVPITLDEILDLLVPSVDIHPEETHFMLKELESIAYMQIYNWSNAYKASRGQDTWQGSEIQLDRWQAAYATITELQRKHKEAGYKDPSGYEQCGESFAKLKVVVMNDDDNIIWTKPKREKE